MSEKRFITKGLVEGVPAIWCDDEVMEQEDVAQLLNEQQELIEELQASDEMGWKRAEMFEKKCPKELHNKKMYIKRLEYKVQKFKEENEQLKQQLLYDGDDVCGICKHEYLTPSGDYFIGRCEKGHEECSKEDIKYCEDFKLKELDDE